MPTSFDGRIQAMRRFNRFYTRQIGVLLEGLVGSPFSLTEVRVLYELAHRDRPTASEIGAHLGLDAGYLSRILVGFEKQGLVSRSPSEADGRRSLLTLTAAGHATFAPLDQRSSDNVAALLTPLPDAGQRQLIDAMETIERLLGGPGMPAEPFVLRPHRPGDMGWVVHRHGVLYAQEYGWDERFEALVAEIVAEFIQSFQPRRERCWIAERDGAIVGSVFLVEHAETVAKLRLLLVEPEARGLGLGRRLIDECVRFARTAGYRSLILWTNDVLVTARRLYQEAGFRLIAEEPHESFGHKLVGETWELGL